VIGETIGSYQILRQLGVGAMGEVYLAEHRYLKRKAAVKLLAPEIIGRPDLLERFFLEARATSAIDHPGIVQIFDCEVDATGRPYIVMEYLDGETLAATLARRGPLPPATVARLARGIAIALEAAHAKGIVHRDIKPENIFVQAQPPDSVKLVDFGIAKLAGDFRAGQVHQTRTGAMMGTPLYMSPEQCRDSGKIDFRTDIYSLGCVVFEMLTGHPPFTQDALGDLVVAHLTEQAKDVRAVNASVPKPLAELTAELLRKDPAERPANMRAVADRLTAFLGGLTTVPESPSPAPPAPAHHALAAAPAQPTAPSPASLAPAHHAFAAAPARPAAAPPAHQKTTFGDAASELVTDGDAATRSGRRAPMVLGLAAAAVALVAGGILLSRRAPMPGGAPATAAASSNPAARPAAPAVSGSAISGSEGAPQLAGTARETEPPHRSRPAGHRVAAAASAERLSRPVAARPSAAGPPEAEVAVAAEAPLVVDFTGVWEGPWTDPERHQNGRLYIQIGGDGAARGWMTNAAVRQSFRLSGSLAGPGDLALACECPPRQGFAARVLVHPAVGGELRGQLALSSGTGIFGQSHLLLRRAAAR
jgi:tRNA A-37 threonylcarbamoyl transferase component Bud32